MSAKYRVVSPLVYNVLVASIGKDKTNKLKNEQLDQLTHLILRYVFKMCNYQSFGELTFLNGAERNSLRGVCSHFYQLFRFKLICLRHFKEHKLFRAYHIRKELAQNKLSPQDYKLILFCANNYSRELTKLVNSIPEIPYPKEVEKEYDGQFVYLRKYATNVAYKKLRFLMSSNKLDADDFVFDMLSKAARAFFYAVPYIKGLHLTNTAKTAINNHAVNLINHYSYGKRKRLYATDDGGYENIIQVDNFSKIDSDDTERDMYRRFSMPETEQVLVSATIEKLYSTLATTNRRKTVFDLVLLKNDAGFVAWYNKSHKSNAPNTETIYERNKAKYMDLVREYTHFNKPRFDLLVAAIRSELRQ